MNDEARLFNALLSLFGISAMAAASRSIMSEDRRSIKGFLRGLILALFVGITVGALIQDYGFSASTQAGIVSICSFVADDLLLMVLGIATRLRNNPRFVIDFVITRLGGTSGGGNTKS